MHPVGPVCTSRPHGNCQPPNRPETRKHLCSVETIALLVVVHREPAHVHGLPAWRLTRQSCLLVMQLQAEAFEEAAATADAVPLVHTEAKSHLPSSDADADATELSTLEGWQAIAQQVADWFTVLCCASAQDVSFDQAGRCLCGSYHQDWA